MGLFPVLLCITNTCSMMSMIARGEVHRPSGVQHDIWSWVTLCTRPDCKIKDRRKYRAGVISSNTGYRSLHTQSQEWMIYSCHMTAADKPAYISLTLVLVTLSIRCMKPFICVAWRTNTLNSPYFCPFLMSSVGQYWWHTSWIEEASIMLIYSWHRLCSTVTLLAYVVAKAVLTTSAYCCRNCIQGNTICWTFDHCSFSVGLHPTLSFSTRSESITITPHSLS